ncbi:Nuclear pore complex protein Nup85 [Blattella germanica]|nr:Nuclear pore complex protein Nup85 [Blattella germanica]
MENENTFAIPEEIFGREGVGLKAVWIPGNKLGVHAYQHVNAFSKDKPSEFAPCKSLVHSIKADIILFDPITRKLINESNGTFLAVQKLAANAGARDIRAELLKLSRQYRSIVRAALANLQSEASTGDSTRKDVCLNLVAVFYSIEFLWHLCEILFVDYVPGKNSSLAIFISPLQSICKKEKFHFFHADRQADALLAGNFRDTAMGIGAENEPEYWNTVIGLVLQGRLEKAKRLLKLHSAGDTSYGDQVYGNLSLSEFNIRWKTWQMNVHQKIDNDTFTSRKELELLMKFMAAWLLYTEPTVKSFDLTFHAHQCIGKFGGMSKLNQSEYVILSLMESDLHQVVKQIEQITENGWFAAHLTDLLYHCDCLKILDNQQLDVGNTLHEQLLLDYGSMLMSHHSLWQVGVSYLDYCPTYGRAHLEMILPTLPLRTEARAMKIIQVARERDMNHIVASICKIMGMRSYQQHRLGNALTWALRSQDAGFATYLANKFLELYSQEGKFHSMDLLDNLGSCMLVSDRLTFLGKYCEFHQLYIAGEFREAAVLLVSLLASRLAPKTFWMTLLTDALPLLESNDIVFTSEDTYELLNCMGELLGEGYIPETGNDKQSVLTDQSPEVNNILEEKVKLIRLALGRNLARSLNHEGCLFD